MEENKPKKKLTAEEWIAGIILLFMLVLMFVNVFTRYVINISIGFTEELVSYLFIAASIFGASAACARGANMGMDAIVSRFSPRVQVVFEWIGAVLSVVLFGILIYYSIDILQSQMRYGSTTAQMRLPQWYFTLPLPIGAAFFCFRIVQRAIRFTKSNRKKEEE